VIALLSTSVIGTLLVALIVRYGGRRDPALPLTWGEAMAAATFIFFLLFWWYGVIPHQWLAYADNELSWRSDAIIVKPSPFFPITLTKVIIRDVIVVGIYGIGLGLQIYLWSWWQNRGKAKPAELPTSRYGRPLVKKTS
jgi:hypothetical protein